MENPFTETIATTALHKNFEQTLKAAATRAIGLDEKGTIPHFPSKALISLS